jgi:hypothetical protein
MWRPAHGATSRPGPSRPAGGYGRAPGRPGPRAHEAPSTDHGERVLDPTVFAELQVERDVEAPAPVTP